jgi:hypothetical protein
MLLRSAKSRASPSRTPHHASTATVATARDSEVQDALQPVEEAVGIRRMLAEAKPRRRPAIST